MTVYHQREWTVYAHKHRAPNRSQPHNYGSNALIQLVPGLLNFVKGRGCYHGVMCGKCIHFEDCKERKGVPAHLDYCVLQENAFKLAGTA